MKQQSQKSPESAHTAQFWLLGGLAIAWCAMVLAASSRLFFVMNYGVVETVDPLLEPFAASNGAMLFCGGVIGAWCALFAFKAKTAADALPLAIGYLGISMLPLAIWLVRVAGWLEWPAQLWEVLWLAGWTGMSFGALARSGAATESQSGAREIGGSPWIPLLVVMASALVCGGWWFSQSVGYHRDFMLGFNDFGHFLQRVANTAAGRGILLESPVLPMFWDHFNPGLLAVVPLWQIYPDVRMVFGLQAAALAGSGIGIYAISRRLGHGPWTAAAFGLAWLAQPAVGQMNLAYTYGWHPITLAIPLLLAAIWYLLARKRVAALVCTLLAMSMEEGVFVIVALAAAVCAGMPLVERCQRRRFDCEPARGEVAAGGLVGALSTWAWFAVAMCAAGGFVLVYQFSGLAEFQTGRFVALGNSPLEILMSPMLRPGVFWGQVLKWDNVVFVALLWLPCGLPALWRGWRYMLPTLVPLAVLIVWDHRPAHSLAFQYPSTLLPFFWLASLTGAAGALKPQGSPPALPSAVMALATGLVLSLFVGQLPFSSPTLRDVEATTYGADSEQRRRSDAEDGRWLLRQVAEVRATQAECLATGRIAAHLVGNRDVETVGQYAERRLKLAELPDRSGEPIRYYQWILLDRREAFQQSRLQIDAIEAEARASGFEVVADQFDVVILSRP